MEDMQNGGGFPGGGMGGMGGGMGGIDPNDIFKMFFSQGGMGGMGGGGDDFGSFMGRGAPGFSFGGHPGQA